MKNKGILVGISALSIAFLAGITVMGASELGLIGNSTPNNQSTEFVANQQDKLNIFQPVALNPDTNAFEWSQVSNLSATTSQTATVKENVQEIVTQLEPYGYPALTVQKDVPVKWTIVADAATLNSCNNEIIIPNYEILKTLNVGDNVIEFTPTESGIIQYSCWMGMINSTIAVVDDINNYDEAEIQAQIANLPQAGGCCCGN